MFVSVEVAEWIDAAEARLSASIGRSVVERNVEPGAFVEEIAGGVAVFAGPMSPTNKLIGAGFHDVPDEDALADLESRFRERGAPLAAEVATLASPAFASLLTARGYRLMGFENVLGRELAAPLEHSLPAGVEIRAITDAEKQHWLEMNVTAFLHPDEQGVPGESLPSREDLLAVIGVTLEAPGFTRYLATVDGEPAGVAVLRMDGELAQLCGGSTLPRFRRRGVQTALLARRLVDAQEQGGTLALMTTLPGSKSQENGQRQGFGLLYSRAVLVLPPGRG